MATIVYDESDLSFILLTTNCAGLLCFQSFLFIFGLINLAMTCLHIILIYTA